MEIPNLPGAQIIEDKSKGILHVEAWGASGDGTTDDTAAIQSAINAAVANGGGIVKLKNGSSYLLSIAGTASFYIYRNCPHCLIIDGDDVVIEGPGTIKFNVASTTNGEEHIIDFGYTGADNVRPWLDGVWRNRNGVRNVTFTHLSTDATPTQNRDICFQYCQDFFVTGCSFTYSRRAIWSSLSSRRGMIANNTFTRVWHSCIWLDGAWHTVVDGNSSNICIGNFLVLVVNADNNVDCQYNTITNNTTIECSAFDLTAAGTSYTVVRGNNFRRDSHIGPSIDFHPHDTVAGIYNSHGNLVDGNIITGGSKTTGGVAITLYGKNKSGWSNNPVLEEENVITNNVITKWTTALNLGQQANRNVMSGNTLSVTNTYTDTSGGTAVGNTIQ